MSNELVQIVQTSGLEQTKGQKLLTLFTPYFNRMAEIESKINLLNKDNPSKEDTIIAKEIRLALKSNRVASEKIKDENKAAILIEGRLIDNLNNIIKNTSKPLEERCEQIEKFAEIQEQKRKEEQKANRLQLLKPYESQEGYFNFNYDLLNLSDEAFADLLSGAKLNYEARIEAAKKAEEERIAREKAEAEEKERIRQENIKLKAEAEAQAKAEAEKKAKEKKEKDERFEKRKNILLEMGFKYFPDAEYNFQLKNVWDCFYEQVYNPSDKEFNAYLDAINKAKKDQSERAEQEAKLRKEREERERLEAELKAKQAKEESEKKTKALAEKKAKAAPDKVKILQVAEILKSISLPEVSTEEAKAILRDIQVYLNNTINLINKSAQNL